MCMCIYVYVYIYLHACACMYIFIWENCKEIMHRFILNLKVLILLKCNAMEKFKTIVHFNV